METTTPSCIWISHCLEESWKGRIMFVRFMLTCCSAVDKTWISVRSEFSNHARGVIDPRLHCWSIMSLNQEP
jgi:hypothetical protein